MNVRRSITESVVDELGPNHITPSERGSIRMTADGREQPCLNDRKRRERTDSRRQHLDLQPVVSVNAQSRVKRTAEPGLHSPNAGGGAAVKQARYAVAAASASLRISSVSRAFNAENSGAVFIV